MEWYKYNITDMNDIEYQTFYSMMSSYKQECVNKFRYTEDKKRTVAGEMLVRKIISQKCNAPVEAIKFDLSVYGKPYVVNFPVTFSISHSGNYAVCAVDENPVGIDIEKIRAVDLNVAKHICSQDELSYLFGHNPSNEDFMLDSYGLLVNFFKIWTAKEARYKCLGNGTMNFKEINVCDILSDDSNFIKLSDNDNREYIISIVSQTSNCG